MLSPAQYRPIDAMKCAITEPPPGPFQMKSALPSWRRSAAVEPGAGGGSSLKISSKSVGAPSMRENATLWNPAAASTSGAVPAWPKESGSHAAVGWASSVSSANWMP